VIAVIGATMTGRATAAMLGAASETSSAPLADRRPVLVVSFAVRVALLVGVVFLMTVKPAAWQMSLATVALTGVMGLLVGLPALRQAPRPETVP
jgi:hypothetical protein